MTLISVYAAVTDASKIPPALAQLLRIKLALVACPCYDGKSPRAKQPPQSADLPGCET